MVVELLQPFYLWGLLGLAVPVLIHLLHRRSQKVIKVGSLQAFRGGSPVLARRLRPNELLLLLLRCLLLALFVLLLCEPVLFDQKEEKKRALFIAPELVAGINTDSLLLAGYEPRLLQPGLPLLQEGTERDTSRYSYWDVFQEIDSMEGLVDTVYLQFYPWQQRFSGKRPRLFRYYEALPVPEPEVKKQFVWALQQPNNKVLLQWWEQQQALWVLKSDTLALADAAPALAPFGAEARLEQPDTLQLVIQYSPAYRQEAVYWQRALELLDSLAPETVVQQEILIAAETSEMKPEVWLWLSEEEPSAAFREAGTTLRFYLDKGNGQRWFKQNRQDLLLYHIQFALQEQQNNRDLMADFLPQLLQVMPVHQPDKKPLLLLPEEQWQPQKAVQAQIIQQQAKSLEQWVWLALLLVFILERWLSLHK